MYPSRHELNCISRKALEERADILAMDAFIQTKTLTEQHYTKALRMIGTGGKLSKIK